MLVDSHCHVSPVWYEPVEVLVFQMDRCGVGRAVLTQLLGQVDNAYQQACLTRFPGRFASIVAVDPRSPEAPRELERLAADGAAGVRLRPDSPPSLWHSAARCGLAVSCVGTTGSFTAPAFAERIEAHPALAIVLEHLGGIARPDADATREQVFDLARWPNVALKVPGLGQLRRRKAELSGAQLFEPDDHDFLDRAIDRFGAARLMWGSDFPPVAAREGYANALDGVRTALAHHSLADRDRILGGTAEAMFFRSA